MDIKKKLVKLLCKVQDYGTKSTCEEWSVTVEYRDNETIVDHLIANGVTMQKWISVKDRLPEIPDGWAENPEPVLYMMKNTKTIYAGYYGEGGIWRDKYFRQYHDEYEGVDADDVLCWMWQKDLPKGE